MYGTNYSAKGETTALINAYACDQFAELPTKEQATQDKLGNAIKNRT